jgi:hypothetical protein
VPYVVPVDAADIALLARLTRSQPLRVTIITGLPGNRAVYGMFRSQRNAETVARQAGFVFPVIYARGTAGTWWLVPPS